MSEFPSFVSPRLEPAEVVSGTPPALDLPSIISPSFTPLDTLPSTPNPIPVTKDYEPVPSLPETLPEVECLVRARIPTTTGTEIFLHLYKNNVDEKEHLAIVFGNDIRSKSLDRVREGETEMDRMIRGAYVGRLYPGRQTSKEDPKLASGDAHPDHKSIITL